MGEKLSEFIAWLRIVASPTIAGLILAAVFYLWKPFEYAEIVAIIIAIAGFITGIVWAKSIAKKRSYTDFVSRINASPELDKRP